jgi:hypothetical protein
VHALQTADLILITDPILIRSLGDAIGGWDGNG